MAGTKKHVFFFIGGEAQPAHPGKPCQAIHIQKHIYSNSCAARYNARSQILASPMPYAVASTNINQTKKRPLFTTSLVFQMFLGATRPPNLRQQTQHKMQHYVKSELKRSAGVGGAIQRGDTARPPKRVPQGTKSAQRIPQREPESL